MPLYHTRFISGLVAILLSVALLAGCESSEERAQSYYERGVELLEKGELVKAALDFRNALKLRENFPDALFGLAQVEERQNRFDTAAKLYLAVAEADPQNVAARVRLASILIAARQIEAAKKYAEEAFALAPADPSVLVVKAALALNLNNRGEAVLLANDALKLSPGNSEALMVLVSERLMASDTKSALALIDEGLSTNQRNIGLQLLKMQAFEKLGDDPSVEKLFIELAVLFPETSVFRDGLIRWYVAKARRDDAAKVIRQHALDNPTDAAAQLQVVALINTTEGAASALKHVEELVAKEAANKGANLFTYREALSQLQFTSGNRDGAIATLRDLVAVTEDLPKKNSARVQLARMLATGGDRPGAIELTNAVIAEDAKNVDALALRAAVRMDDGDSGAAIGDLVAALAEAPENAGIVKLLGEAHERSGSVVLAEEQYVKALSLSNYAPANGVALSQFLLRYGRNGQAEKVLEDLRSRGTADRQSLSLLAQLKLNRRDFAGAQEIGEALKLMDASEGAGDQILAAALGGMDRQAEGIAILQSALARANNRPEALAALVRAYSLAGKTNEAIDALQKALNDDPANVQAHVMLGAVQFQMGDKPSAEASFKAAIAADAARVEGDIALIEFYAREGRGEEAEAAARAGLQRRPGNNALRLQLALLLEADGRADEAIAVYTELLRDDPTSTVAANNLASLLSEKSNDEAALERAYTIAQRFQNSEVPQFQDTLGWIHYLRGEHVLALPMLRDAAQRLPQYGLVQYHYGMVLKALDQGALSAETLAKSIELAPSPDAAYLVPARQALADLKNKPSGG